LCLCEGWVVFWEGGFYFLFGKPPLCSRQTAGGEKRKKKGGGGGGGVMNFQKTEINKN